jgi:hypothetical protein
MLLRQEAVINAIGGEEDFFRECKEGTCVGELAKKANADYGARCDVFKMDKDLILKFELYSVKDEAILETFTDYNVKDFRGMLAVLEQRLPGAFRKMLSGGPAAVSSSSARGGIADVSVATGAGEAGENFGFLRIKPAYSDGIGNGKPWSVTIDKEAYSSYENDLSVGSHDVKLGHECYEDISFKASIENGKFEVFDMAKYLNLKRGTLVLTAEEDGQSVTEPVFANGKKIGETPFRGSVSVCAEITIGNNKNKVDVKIEYKQTVRHHTAINILSDNRDGKKYKTVKIGTQSLDG